jgi:hypothetical protein
VTRGSSRAVLRQNVGAGAQVTFGGPGAAPSYGGTWRLWSCPEPWGHVAAPKLPQAGSESQSHGDTWRPQSYPQPGGWSHCLDMMLVCGVPGPQGTDRQRRVGGVVPVAGEPGGHGGSTTRRPHDSGRRHRAREEKEQTILRERQRRAMSGQILAGCGSTATTSCGCAPTSMR